MKITLMQKYESMTDDEKVSFLFGLEATPCVEALYFLLSVMENINEYDLARIEAIKSVGLLASQDKIEVKEFVANKLILLAYKDHDDDIRNYSLQALCWLADIDDIPKKIENIILNQQEDELVREASYAVIISQKNNPDSQNILKKLLKDSVFADSAAMDLNAA